MMLRFKWILFVLLLLIFCEKRDFKSPYDPKAAIKTTTPYKLTAEVLSDTEIKLQWKYKGPTLGFKIERKDSAKGRFKQLAQIEKDTTSYIDTKLKTDIHYYYRVKAFTASSESFADTDINHVFPVPSGLKAESLSDKEIKLTWQDSCSFEKGFQIERKVAKGESWKQVGTVGKDSTAYIDNNLTYNIGYFYRIKAFTESNESDYSDSVLMSTCHPSATLISPENEIIINKTVINFSWKAFVNVSGYHIQIGNDAGLSNLEFETNNLTEAFYTSPVLTEGIHYWRVRVKDVIGNGGSWSDVWHFTIDTQGPNAPTLYTPNRYAKLTDASPSFDWSDVNTAENYELLVDNNLYFNTPPEIHKTSLTSSEYIATESLANGRYHWKVRCRDNVGNYGDWSYVWHFDIDAQGPGTPTLYTPENSTTVNEVAPTFDWSDVSEAVSYELIVDNNSDFGSSEIHQTNLTSSEYTTSNFLSNGKYYWKVRCIDGAGIWGGWSEIWNFAIHTKAPTAPTLLSPVNNIVMENNDVIFSWEGDTGSVAYQLQVDEVINFSSPIINLDNLSSLSFFTKLSGGLYYWRVRAKNRFENYSEWSPIWNFITVIPAPSNLRIEVISDNEVRLRWNDNSSFEEGFVIEKRFLLDDFSELERVNSNDTAYVDRTLSAPQENIWIDYRVAAFVKGYTSPYDRERLEAQIFKYIGDFSTSINLNSLAFSPDSRFLAICGNENYNSGKIEIIDVNNWSILNTLSDNTSDVMSVHFSPNNQFLASGSADNSLRIWNVSSWNLEKTITGHSGYVNSVAFSPDGKYLASGSSDHTIRIWNVGSWTQNTILLDHSDRVNEISFSLDGKYLASASNDKTLKIWDINSWSLITTLTPPTLPNQAQGICCLAFSPDGKYLTTPGSFGINVWQTSNWSHFRLEYGGGDIFQTAFRPDGKYLVGMGYVGMIGVWRLWETYNIDKMVMPSGGVAALSFSPDGQYLVVLGTRENIVIWSGETKWHWIGSP